MKQDLDSAGRAFMGRLAPRERLALQSAARLLGSPLVWAWRSRRFGALQASPETAGPADPAGEY